MTGKYITEWDEFFGENQPSSNTGANTFVTSQQYISAQLLNLLVWIDLKTSLVRKSFAYYDEYSLPTQCILFSICAYITYKSIRFLIRLCIGSRCTKPQIFAPSPTRHRRKKTPVFPPGMEVNAVLDRWKKEGHEPPLVPLYASHIGQQVEQARQRREISRIPSWEPPEMWKGTSSFGSVGGNEFEGLEGEIEDDEEDEDDVRMAGA